MGISKLTLTSNIVTTFLLMLFTSYLCLMLCTYGINLSFKFPEEQQRYVGFVFLFVWCCYCVCAQDKEMG